jgi:glycosyltransferase involved in cell wall biosynthesis
MSASAPLVSVVIPCYNARPTLPTALASLLAQSYANWECILVDDGSTDRPGVVVELANDPRIRFRRLPENMGLGFVRQVGLEMASGSFLCGLDADDWVFPRKLQSQLEAITSSPRMAAVGTGMSIVDADGEIAGVRWRGPAAEVPRVFGPFSGVRPPIGTVPAMVRMEVARTARFDPTLRATEDTDFFLQFLPGRCYGWLPDVSYVYTERQSATRDKMVLCMRNTRRVMKRHAARHPVLSRLEAGRALGREAAYRGAYALGLGPWLVARRASPAGPADVAEFNAARAEVYRVRDRVFAGL